MKHCTVRVQSKSNKIGHSPVSVQSKSNTHKRVRLSPVLISSVQSIFSEFPMTETGNDSFSPVSSTSICYLKKWWPSLIFYIVNMYRVTRVNNSTWLESRWETMLWTWTFDTSHICYWMTPLATSDNQRLESESFSQNIVWLKKTVNLH